MDPSAMKVNNGCVNASLMDIPTEIKSIFDTETIPPGRNLPFLPRTLHRRFPSRKIIPQYLKVHLVTVKNHKYVVETRPYQRRRDIRCTLCSTKPHMKNRQALWIHCLRKHFEYHPELVRSSDGNTHLLLNKNSKVCDDDSPSREENVGKSCLLYCQRVRLNRFSEQKAPNNVRPPRRIYYDSVFKTPKLEAVWLLDLDSDDEAKDHISFLPHMEAEINDFTDVTPGQKRFMKVWNHFLTHKSDGVTLAPRQLPSICLEFAQNFARRSICDDDEEQFTRSLFNLMDENYLGCLQVEQILKVYREARKSSSRDSVAMPVSPTPSPKQSSPKPMLATMAEYHDSYGADESESHEDDDTF